MGIGRAGAATLLCALAFAGCGPASTERGPVATEAEAEAEAVKVARQLLSGAPDADEPYEVQLDSIGWLVMTAPHVTARGQTRYLVRIDRITGKADIGVYSVARAYDAS